jgi:AcrR family transcriptional regulator
MPRPRFSKLPALRQREILERAAEEFAACGYEHASLNHIIHALGLNKGVFYYNFDSKADLFAAVVQMVWDTAFPAGEFDLATLDRTTFWPSLARLFGENHAQMRQRPWLAGIVRLVLNPPPSARIDATIADLIARGHTWAKALLGRGQQVGAVRTDLPLDVLLDVITEADRAADRWLLANWDRFTPDERDRAGWVVFDLWRRIADPAQAAAAKDGTP